MGTQNALIMPWNSFVKFCLFIFDSQNQPAHTEAKCDSARHCGPCEAPRSPSQDA